MKNVIISVLVVIFVAIAGVCIYFGVTKTNPEDLFGGIVNNEQKQEPTEKNPEDEKEDQEGVLKIELNKKEILFS
ncbi:MAG: hypothetical protein E7358_06595 [Clostridiales bacterium]|nr:hypothetical protein [Clostridiales bacterium]